MFQVKSISLNKDYSQSNYHNMSWYDLAHGRLIQDSNLEFESSIAPEMPDHSELLYYPELAKMLLAMESYPKLRQSFAKPELPRGKYFISAFCAFYESSFAEFEKTLTALTSQFDSLIATYGQKRFTPLINSYEPYQFVINGMSWRIAPNASFDHKNAFNLRHLLWFDEEFYKIEKAIIGTPCLALRLSNNYRNKGHLVWYNLDTCQKITAKEAVKWQPIKQSE